MVAPQLSLFDAPRVALEATFRGAVRMPLPGSSHDPAWVEHVPGWRGGHQLLFDELERSTRFRQEERPLYDQRVQVPRLYATLPEDSPVPDVLERAQRLLNQRYGEAFTRISLGYWYPL